mmetsp:Transcript_30230/g.66952  ORF Transcript_30230/g.66952 Transcript_30230/m.66952 type:complete len:909 (+) Transcript_30230:97-2823(+)
MVATSREATLSDLALVGCTSTFGASRSSGAAQQDQQQQQRYYVTSRRPEDLGRSQQQQPQLLPSVLKLMSMLEPREDVMTTEGANNVAMTNANRHNDKEAEAEAAVTSAAYYETDDNLKSLTKCPQLYDQCVRVLSDLNAMGLGTKKKDRNMPSKLKQLEESRRKQQLKREETAELQRQRAEGEARAETSSAAMDEEDDDDMDEYMDEGNGDNGDEMQHMMDDIEAAMDEDEDRTIGAEKGMSPTQRTVATLNSASVVLPILESLLLHPRCKTASPALPELGPKDKRGKRKKRAYLLGRYVYGPTSCKAFDALERQFRQAVESFGGKGGQIDEDTIRSLEMDEIIDQTLGCFMDTNESATTNLRRAQRLDDAVLSNLSRTNRNLERMHQQSIRRLQEKLSKTIRRRIPDATLEIYGSCLSGLSLGKNSDVDVSLHVPEALRLKESFALGEIDARQYESSMKKLVFRVKGMLQYYRDGSFVDLFAVPRARIPVIKGRDRHANCPYSDDGSLCFDICLLNDIAVANSSLLGEYSRIDPRVRQLMLAVKSFVKRHGIGSAADGYMSSYTWMVLTIFYLQCIGFVPNLQEAELMRAHGFVSDPETNPAHGVNGLDTAFLFSQDVLSSGHWAADERVVNLPVSALLLGLFRFYARVFPRISCVGAVSIRLGRCGLQKTVFSRSARLWRICIEDPFETHSSHFPHDLGIHCDERGHTEILTVLVDACAYVESVLAMESDVTANDALRSLIVVSDDSAGAKEDTGRASKGGGSKGGGSSKSSHSRRKKGKGGRNGDSDDINGRAGQGSKVGGSHGGPPKDTSKESNARKHSGCKSEKSRAAAGKVQKQGGSIERGRDNGGARAEEATKNDSSAAVKINAGRGDDDDFDESKKKKTRRRQPRKRGKQRRQQRDSGK